MAIRKHDFRWFTTVFMLRSFITMHIHHPNYFANIFLFWRLLWFSFLKECIKYLIRTTTQQDFRWFCIGPVKRQISSSDVNHMISLTGANLKFHPSFTLLKTKSTIGRQNKSIFKYKLVVCCLVVFLTLVTHITECLIFVCKALWITFAVWIPVSSVTGIQFMSCISLWASWSFQSGVLNKADTRQLCSPVFPASMGLHLSL